VMVGYCADVFVFNWRKNDYVKVLREFRHRSPGNGNWNANYNVGLYTQLRWPNRWTISFGHLNVPLLPSARRRTKLPTHFIKHTRKKHVTHKIRKRKHLASFMALSIPSCFPVQKIGTNLHGLNTVFLVHFRLFYRHGQFENILWVQIYESQAQECVCN
jgi:hypothetical protein